MPAVPEILLRKLFVKGSLKSLPDGFVFQLNDTLLAVSLTGIRLSANCVSLSPGSVEIGLVGCPPVNTSDITKEERFALPMNTPVTVKAVSSITNPDTLTIEADTVEMGLLRFSINLKVRQTPAVWRGVKGAIQASVNLVRAVRVACDPQHPIYHFSPPANWMNDPNGLICWQGKTHLFYQYNPAAPVWGSIHWGHAVSTDLVHWKRQPIAMHPTPNTPNEDGCWSGSAVITPDGPVFYYTAVFPETVCMARPDKDFSRLVNDTDNPVISAPPQGLELEGFRDPCVWREGDEWYLTLGSGFKGVGGAILLYQSKDLKHWDYLHPLLTGDQKNEVPFPTGTMWECPQLVQIDEQYFLFISAIIDPKTQYTIYFQGKMKDHRFIPTSVNKPDQGGGTVYAPLTFEDDKNRRILFGWIKEEREEAACRKAGWAGTMTLPRVLSLSPGMDLLIDPAPEVSLLRKAQIATFSGELADQFSVLSGTKTLLNAEIEAKIQFNGSNGVEFVLASSPHADERTVLMFDVAHSSFMVDTTAASRDPLARGVRKECTLPLCQNEPLDLRIFLDGSVLEVYANHRVVMTSRLFPTGRAGLRLFARSIDGKNVDIHSTIHALDSCYQV